MSARAGARRNAAQRTTFVVAALVLAVVVGLVVVQAVGADDPPTPVARVSTVRHVGDQWFVAVDLVNEGDATAAEVQVEAELVVDGAPSGGDQTVDFLPGHETRHLTFVFADDPADGELTVGVTGFTDPH